MKPVYLIPVLMCIALVLVAGCTSSGTAPSVPTATSAPQTLAPVDTPIVTSSPAPVVTSAPITTVTTQASDPIEHRYIRQYTDPYSSKWIGYEYKFYPGGVLRYRDGLTKMTSGNVIINQINHEGSGTWINLGNNKYLLKYLLKDDENSAQTIEEYTLVLAHTEPDYPGVVIAEHIESEAELKSINKGEQRRGDYMYFPERAKID